MLRNFLNLEEPQGPIRWPREIAALLAVLSALLIYFQYTTLDKFSVLPPARRYATLHLFIQVVKQNVPLDTGDAVVAGLIVAAFASLIVLELWKKRLSTFLCKVFETETRTLLAVGLTCLLCVRFYFARGDSNLAADTPTHISYAWVASQAFSHGEIPIWTNYFGAGSPYLQFYGFLFFYLCGLVDLLFRDLFFSIKLVMAGGHVFSGIGMYLFVRTLCNSRRAGFLAGIAYVLSVWHIQQVLIMGRLPLSVFYALLPYPFYFFERLLSACLRAARRQACGDAQAGRLCSPKLPCAIGGGLTLALLAFTHPGYAFWATALLVLYVCIRLWSDTERKVLRVVVFYSLLLLVGGLVFGAYLTLPMWVEMDNAGLQFGTHLSWFPDPAWEQLLVWSNYRFRVFNIETNHWYGGYLGLSVVGLASAGLLWGRTKVPAGHSGRRRRRQAGTRGGHSGRRRRRQAGGCSRLLDRLPDPGLRLSLALAAFPQHRSGLQRRAVSALRRFLFGRDGWCGHPDPHPPPGHPGKGQQCFHASPAGCDGGPGSHNLPAPLSDDD